MLKFIHAADFHMDSAFGALSASQAASRRRESRELLVSLIERVELTEDREVIVKFRFAHLDETAENQAPQAAAPSETAQISGTSHLQ